MRLSAQEEYGLRCLLQIARQGEQGTLTIVEISRAEGLSKEYVAKLMRVLRRGGLVESVRGQSGGYRLARPASGVAVGEVVAVLGGRLFEPNFCERHSGTERLCTHSVDCSIRSLWGMVQGAVDQVLSHITLKDMLRSEVTLTSLKTESASLAAETSQPHLT